MSVETIKLNGKTLPVEVAQGLIDAIRMPNPAASNFNAIVSVGAAAVTSSHAETDEWLKWVEPLWAYRDRRADRQPLDYAYLAILYLGIQKMYLPSDDGMAGITRRIGRDWWTPASPLLSVRLQKNRLYDFVYPSIIEALQARQNLFTDESFNPTNQYEPIKYGFSTALETFTRILQQKTGIEAFTYWQDDNFVIEIPECPLSNNRPHCQLFLGVVDGLLFNLYGGYEGNFLELICKIDELVSTGQRIVLSGSPDHL